MAFLTARLAWAAPVVARRVTLLGVSAFLLAAVYAVVRATGGSPSPLIGATFPAIVLAALGGGWRGGAVAGIVASLLTGPLMPARAGSPVLLLGAWAWMVRPVADVAAGVLVGAVCDRSRETTQASDRRAARREIARAVHASEERLRRTIEATADGIVVLDAEGRLVHMNGRAERILGVRRAEVLGLPYQEATQHIGAAFEWASPGAMVSVAATLASRHETHHTELAIRLHSGGTVFVELAIHPLPEDGGPAGAVVTLHDVTAERALARENAERVDAVREAARQAAGASSAPQAGAQLLAAFARTWPLVAAVIYVFDADGVRRLASWPPEHGRRAGDASSLLHAAPALRELATDAPARRPLDEMPVPQSVQSALKGRGAHSIVSVPLRDSDDLVGLLLVAQAQEPSPLGAAEMSLVAAVGPLAAALVRRAENDEASTTRRIRARTARLLENPALLVPHFQPILDLAQQRVVGYEALARFSVGPAQPPSVWFAQAAKVGLGADLQAIAVERALHVAREAGLPSNTFLSVNVSPRYLASPEVSAALPAGSLDWLVIEVTEEEAVADYDALREAMAPLLARGARIAVDDAGAGYASMRHVTELRPAFVKLDAELVRGVGDDGARQALVRALVDFTTAVGATPIAEGVEDLADLALLARTRQPLLVQGYAIARPGPAWPSLVPGVGLCCANEPCRPPSAPALDQATAP